MLADLETQIREVKADARRKGQQRDRVAKLVEEKVAAAEQAEQQSRGKRGAGALGLLQGGGEEEGESGEAMDVDVREGIRRSTKRGGFGMVGRQH